MEHPRRRGVRLVLCERCGPRRADAHADRRTAPTASPGCSASRTSRVGGRTRITTGRAAWKRDADGLGAGGKADLVHRARLPGDRQGRQPAERLLRSEIVGIGAAVFLQRRARRLSAARLYRRLSALLRPRPSALQRIEPGLVGLWRADARSGASDALGVGRAAFSLFSRSDRRLVGRRELGARPLAERPARQATVSGIIDAVLPTMPSPTTRSPTSPLVGGYVVNDVLSARGTLEPLIEAFRVNAADAGDRILFRGLARRRTPSSTGDAGRARRPAAGARAARRRQSLPPS